MNSFRKSTVSGMFYNADKITLEKQITKCFVSDQGPGSIPQIQKTNGQITGIIVPHAGYSFSGAIAAHAYHAVTTVGFADVFIILGPNHQGYGPSVAMSSAGIWKTPLGEIPVDESVVNNLKQGISIIDDDTMNQRENSIEVQLPFLQFIAKRHPFSIVPLALSSQDKNTARTLGRDIASVLEKEDRTIILIASTDFSHEGFAYGRRPPQDQNVNEYVASQDSYAIEKIKEMDPDGLIDVVYKHHISMCGFGPVASILHASKMLGTNTVELLKYGSSYDVSPDISACVGYASFVIS